MSKETRYMQLPRIVVVGHDVIYDISKVCKDLKLSGRALIVTGNLTKEIAGNTAKDVLEEAAFDVDMIITKNASMTEVEKVKKAAKKLQASFLLGVGGGRCIDIAKLASTQLKIPFLSVPSAASHDGIASSRASINQGRGSISIEAQAPLALIADTRIIMSAPYKLLASGCGDLISNITAVLDWQLAYKLKNEPYSEYAAALSQMAAQIIEDQAQTIRKGIEESVRIVVKALVSSGVAMSIAGSSRPASGSEHNFSHALDQIAPKPALHGEQCGVGAIMMMYLHGGNWIKIRDTLKAIGAPTNASELGIDDRYIVKALMHAHRIRPERYTILGSSGLTEEAAEKLAQKTGVIS